MASNKQTKSCDYERKFAGEHLASVDTDGAFAGYASIFNAIDLGQEVVAKGAFKKSLQAKGAGGVKLLFQHNPDEPIGHWIDIKEDTKGLYVKGQLNLDVTRAREVHSLMQNGSVDGLSIGFKTVRSRREQGGDIRRILEADLWEISIVTFPMLPQARVTDVKAQSALPSTREFERWLVRDAGLTRSQAKTVIVKGFSSLNGGRDAADNITSQKRIRATGLADKIRLAAKMMQTR